MDENLSFQVELGRHDCRSVWELICRLRLKRQSNSPELLRKYKHQENIPRDRHDHHVSTRNSLG
jgi:hypothetical protein